MPRGNQGLVGWGLRKPDLVSGSPALNGGLELDGL